MDRRTFLTATGTTVGSWATSLLVGCRGHQHGHIVEDCEADMVGSHAAGAAVYNPLIEEAVGKLLARQRVGVDAASFQGDEVLPASQTICFVGVENRSIEELGDFKDQIYQQIDTMLVQAEAFQPLSKRVVEAALRETRLRPDALLMPDNMATFTSVFQRQGQPLNYLLFATLTSGTTVRNKSQQRDYLLTLELVNVHTGAFDKQSATIRKGYHKTRAGEFWKYNPLTG